MAPAETPKQPQECSQRTQQPQHQRDQPKGHSLWQQQKLEEPSPPHMDWSRSQGRGEAMHNSRRAEPPDEMAARVRAMPPTNTVRGRRRTGQAAEVAEVLILSARGEYPPAARRGMGGLQRLGCRQVQQQPQKTRMGQWRRCRQSQCRHGCCTRQICWR